MSGWVKVSADWFEDPQIEELGAEATMLHLSGLGYSARHLTNGQLPSRALRRLYPVLDPDASVKVLVQAGKWEPVEDGFLIVDWQVHILSADEVGQLREASRITSERHRRHNNGDHSMCDRCAVVRRQRDAVTDAVSDSVSDAAPIRSDPIRSGGEEERIGEGVGSSATSDGLRSAAPASSAPPPLVPGRPPGIVAVNGVPVLGPSSKREAKP